MDWVTPYARSRGAETRWNSLTTGKGAETFVGAPHDMYGMTPTWLVQVIQFRLSPFLILCIHHVRGESSNKNRHTFRYLNSALLG